MKKILNQIIKNWLFIVIVLQPILDIVAYFSFNDYITPISFVCRTFILFLIIVITFFSSKEKKKFILKLLPIAIFGILHFLNSYRVGLINIFDDLRYFVIVFQMPVLTICLIDYVKSNKKYLYQIKKGIIVNVFIIATSVILALLTNTASYTYTSYGITGWFSSANTQSMILSILCPLFIFYFTKNNSKIKYIIAILVSTFLLYFNGTKACFITLIISLFAIIYINIFSTKKNIKIFKVIFSILIMLIIIFSFNFSNTSKRSNELDKVSEENKVNILKKYYIKNTTKEEKLTLLKSSYYYRDLIKIFGEEKVLKKMEKNITASSISDNRLRKRVCASIIFDDQDIYTKMVGFEFTKIGKLGLDLENDITAIFYYYGYIGFVIYSIYILYFIYLFMITFIKNKNSIVNGEYVILGVTLCLILFGSEYSGAFLRKSNANIYLSLLLTLSYFKCLKLSKVKINKNKISFLLLHLGYGGIETATINTVNELSNKYEIELVSFYNLKNNQEKKLDKSIKIKYLYDGEPNREDFKNAVKNKNILSIIYNSFKAVNIIFNKKYLISKYIKKCDSFAIVSTRLEFSILLSKYGSKKIIKIAQEHRHHNNNKKYIKKLKTKINNINYLFALTKTLKSDYKTFLKNNKKIKIVLVPNMISIPEVKSNIKEKNIISIGRLQKGKKINELIDIFQKLKVKKSKLYIIGDGDEYLNLKQQIADLKLENRVILTGYLSKEEFEPYILDSSVFAMTSITEGLPMVLLEAMSYGLPCIAYETESGVKDIIDDRKNGYIIKNRSEKEYIEKLNKLLTDDKILKNFSSEAIHKSEKFSNNEIVKIWIKILKNNKDGELYE